MAKSGVEKILDKWRGLIKSKKRMIISLEEIIEQKIDSLRPWIHPETEPLRGWQYRQFQYTNKQERIWVDGDWRPIDVGQTWGGPDMSAYFRCKAVLPKRFQSKKVALKVYFSGDGLLRVNGEAFHGLDPFRDTVLMTDRARGGEEFDLEAEAYIMWHFGEGEIKTLECSHWAVVDQEMSDAYWDLKTAFAMLLADGLDTGVVAHLREVFYRATKCIDQNCKDASRAKAMALRAREIVRKEIYESDRFKKEGVLHLTGNSHLDLMYLWPYSEFVRKVGRTHATALRLMEQYPEYRFTQSQPLMYAEMKKTFPELYQQVKRRIREGRWEAIGAFWVEPDCNLISGESMVRQILYGIRFYREEFGITPQTAWIPDVFGNCWTMPQILRKSGLKYFVTHKMPVWNDTNPWTTHAFWWEGPDGSRVFAVMPPTHFIGTAEPDHLKDHWDRYSAKATVGESLYCYGWGDGGGGPDVEMLEYLKRADRLPGLPSCRNSTIEEALERMHQRALQAELPIINDELYLEEHRGVYTTKGRLKKLNRYCEHLFRNAEIFSCFANLPYPRAELETGWKEILANQFHDAVTGTQMTAAYRDLLDSYQIATDLGEGALHAALGKIVSCIDTTGEGNAVVLFNSLPFTRDSRISLPFDGQDAQVRAPDGTAVPVQQATDYRTGATMLTFEATGIPSVGYATYRVFQGSAKSPEPKADAFPSVRATQNQWVLENAHLCAAINDRGEVVSLIEKRSGRECIDSTQRGNVVHLYEDMPGTFQAWDIEEHYADLEFPVNEDVLIEALEQGPVLASLLVTRRFGNSRMTQRIVLGASSRRLDFETWVDWKEQHKLLKVRFHTTIRSRRATYDIAYGNIDRPTTKNNSYEKAKFEVCGHEWMDLSQADHGLSLLTDCKYGYQAHDRMIALTLLKGPKYPDPVSDQEEHWFTYSLYPHGQSWREAATIEAAADLNDPVLAIPSDSHRGDMPSTHSFVVLEGSGLTLEAVKQAEDGDDLVVRITERLGGRTRAALRIDCPFEAFAACDLMESPEESLCAKNGVLQFEMGPYEIRTFRLRRSKV